MVEELTRLYVAMCTFMYMYVYLPSNSSRSSLMLSITEACRDKYTCGYTCMYVGTLYTCKAHEVL